MKYKTELHCHTKESSSCSKIDAKQLVEWYFKEGYSTIVVTDHCSKRKMERLGNIPWKEKVEYITRGYYIAKKIGNMLGMSILLGVEITLEITDSDYLIYGIKEDFLKKHEKIYTYSLEKLYEICKENGLLLVQAHPFRDEIELAPLEYIDGIEVFNGCHDEVSRNEKAFEYGKNTDKILTSGSDFHAKDDLARGGIITENKIDTIEQLVDVLKLGKYELIERK